MADAHVLRLVRRRAGPADLGRRRRVAHLRDVAAPSRADHADHGLGAARARARRRRHARCSPASGFLLAIGRYPIGAYLWLEVVFVVGDDRGRRSSSSRAPCAGGSRSRCRSRAASASRRPRGPSTTGSTATATTRDAARRLRASRVALQLTRVLAIYASGRAVGIHLSLLPYVVLGPLLFLVMLVPFTVNGLGVREAFFVSFLGNLGVDADAAFACGFLFFVMTILLALPGARDHPLGERLRPAHAGARWSAECLTSPSSSSRGTRCRGSSSASSRCAGTT